MFSNISIEPFRGNLEGLQKMAHESWRDEYGIESFPDLYRPAFLKFLFERIKDKRHLFAAYKGNELVAFLANLPQKFHFKNQYYRAAYSCLLVTRKEWMRKGLAQAIIQEALNSNKDLKYDFALYALESGHRSTQLIRKFQALGSPVEVVKKFRLIARVMDLDRAAHSEGLKSWEKTAVKLIGGHRIPKEYHYENVREYQDEDIDSCLNLLDNYRNNVTLALCWDREDLAWELNCPDVSRTIVFEKDGAVKGFINFILHEHLAKTKEKWAWINHVAYTELSTQERKEFIRAFLLYIKAIGGIGVIEWLRGYYSTKPLFKTGFFPYFRSVNLVSWTFNQEISLKNIKDVYEIQV